MTNRYTLSDQVRDKWTPVIKRLLEAIEADPKAAYNKELVFDFSDTELNPATVGEILEALGYYEVDREDNGWQMDFWINYGKEDGFKPITISGTGVTFEGRLHCT